MGHLFIAILVCFSLTWGATASDLPPHQEAKTFPVGAHFKIQGAAPRDYKEDDVLSAQHHLVTIALGSKGFDFSLDTELSLFRSREEAEPAKKFSTQKLKQMYMSTRCPARVVEMMKTTPLGTVGFCNRSFNLANSKKFSMKQQDRLRVGYAYTITKKDRDVVFLTLQLE